MCTLPPHVAVTHNTAAPAPRLQDRAGYAPESPPTPRCRCESPVSLADRKPAAPGKKWGGSCRHYDVARSEGRGDRRQDVARRAASRSPRLGLTVPRAVAVLLPLPPARLVLCRLAAFLAGFRCCSRLSGPVGRGGRGTARGAGTSCVRPAGGTGYRPWCEPPFRTVRGLDGNRGRLATLAGPAHKARVPVVETADPRVCSAAALGLIAGALRLGRGVPGGVSRGNGALLQGRIAGTLALRAAGVQPAGQVALRGAALFLSAPEPVSATASEGRRLRPPDFGWDQATRGAQKRYLPVGR
jgi:hypothetical protein